MAQTNAREKREQRLVSKLTDPNNVATPEITHHHAAGLPASGEESRAGSDGTAAVPTQSKAIPGASFKKTASNGALLLSLTAAVLLTGRIDT